MLNMCKLLMCALLVCQVVSCATSTTVTLPDGDIYEVKNKSDGVVTFTKGDVSISVDNRGRPTVFESLTGAVIEKMPTVQIGGD